MDECLQERRGSVLYGEYTNLYLMYISQYRTSMFFFIHLSESVKVYKLILKKVDCFLILSLFKRKYTIILFKKKKTTIILLIVRFITDLAGYIFGPLRRIFVIVAL